MGRAFNQSLENIYSRYLWKAEHQDGMQTYMRTYIVDKYEDSYEIWEIILITVGCCAGLVCMLLAFWAVSRPTDSDRMVNYMSLKRMKREHRKSSLSQQGPYSAMNASLDRSLKGTAAGSNSLQDQTDDSSRSNGNENGIVVEEVV